jgi:hypothetical protein
MRARPFLIAASMVTVAALAGCSGDQGPASDAETPRAVVAFLAMSGAGPQRQQGSVPVGMHSVRVQVDCSGGGVLGLTTNSDASRVGRCSGRQQQFTLPTPQAPVLELNVFVPRAVHVRAMARFSVTRFEPNTDLRTVCDAVSAADQATQDGDRAPLASAVGRLRGLHAPSITQQDLAALAVAYRTGDIADSREHDRIAAACMNNDTPVTISTGGGG